MPKEFNGNRIFKNKKDTEAKKRMIWKPSLVFHISMMRANESTRKKLY